MNIFGKDYSQDIEVLFDATAQLKSEMDELRGKFASNSPASTQELSNRIADLEVKMSKLWNLLITQTPRGEDKLSKYGKVFGGKSKSLM